MSDLMIFKPIGSEARNNYVLFFVSDCSVHISVSRKKIDTLSQPKTSEHISLTQICMERGVQIFSSVQCRIQIFVFDEI